MLLFSWSDLVLGPRLVRGALAFWMQTAGKGSKGERWYAWTDEKRSLAVSSKLHPSGFDELMPKTLATATDDRLMHHAHICQTSGDSIRLTQAIAGKGVIPLN